MSLSDSIEILEHDIQVLGRSTPAKVARLEKLRRERGRLLRQELKILSKIGCLGASIHDDPPSYRCRVCGHLLRGRLGLCQACHLDNLPF